jgi:HAE1 family hydrophobic/amphiphilic exporter-1
MVVTPIFVTSAGSDPVAVATLFCTLTAAGSLPAEVTKISVTTMKRQSSMLKVFTLSSPDDSYDENFLSNYLNINIKPRIQRIQGV